MAKHNETWTDEIAVEIYMADANPPPLYDFFLTRAGALRRTPAGHPVGGLMQVVLAGSYPPSPRQLLTLKRNFDCDGHFRMMVFF